MTNPPLSLYKNYMSSLNKQRAARPEGSLTLAISAAEGRLLTALGHIGAGGEAELLCAQSWLAPAQGVELLAPALEYSLNALKLVPRHIGRIAVVNGPGSFTGLRLSCLTSAGLARAVGARQAALPCLPLLAAQAAESFLAFSASGAHHELWAVTHARRGLVYVQGFNLDPGAAPTRRSEILALSLADAAALLGGRPLTAFGSGVSNNRAFFTAALPSTRFLGRPFDQPSPHFLLSAALNAEYGESDIAPLYVRPSDAEENLPQIAARLGLDPAEAARRLAGILSSPPQTGDN